MPVSGHEETGVKSFAGQFSGLIAGVPIKKRRFPLLRPSSPLPEEPCSLTEETDLQRKEDSSISQGSTLSNASIAGAPIKKRRFPILQASSSPSDEASPASPPEESDALRKELTTTSQGSTLSTSSSSLSETNRNPVFEEKKASSDVVNANMQSKSCLIVPKLEEPNLGAQSRTSDVRDSKEKVIPNEGDKKLESQLIKENPELLLAAKEGLGLSIREDVSKHNIQVIRKQESSVVPESSSLSLSLKDNLFPAAASLKIDGSNPKIQKAEPVSLELSLSKEECSTRSLNVDAKTNSDSSDVQSNRANWDLNTTMDAWEESGTETSSVKTSFDEPKITSSVHDEKQPMCSTGITQPANVVAANQPSEETLKKSLIAASGLYGQQYRRVEHPRDLCFTSFFQKFAEEPSRLPVKLNSGSNIPPLSLSSAVATEEPSRLPVKLNSGSNIPPLSLSSAVATAGDAKTSSFRLVKSEPFDENLKKDLKRANACPVGSLDSVAVKQEFVQLSNIKCSESSNVVNLKIVDSTSIKSEPGQEGNKKRSITSESIMHTLGKELPQRSDIFSSSNAIPVPMVAAPLSAEAVCPPVKPISTAELTVSENIVSQLENRTCTGGVSVEKLCHGAYLGAEQIPLGTVAIPTVGNGTELSDPDVKISSSIPKEENAVERDDCRLKLMNEPPSDPRQSGEGCASDEEKITLSGDMLEDDSYGSDYESDDNHAVTIAVDTEQYVGDDDYEDGEVREPLEPSAAEDTICEVREVEHRDCNDYDNKQAEKLVVKGDCPTSSHYVENNKTVIHSEINNEDNGMDIEMHERPGKVVDKNACLQESLDENPNSAADGKKLVDVLQRKPLDLPEGTYVSEAVQTEFPSNQAPKGSPGVDDVQCADEVVKTTDTDKQPGLDLPKMEASTNTDDAIKDCSNGGNQGRIIDLSRAASSSSPSKTRPISGRSLPSRAGRDVLSDTLDGDKIYRGRDEVYIDGPHKFSRERHQDISPRNSRLNFVRGRGRVNNRLDSLRGEWECDREFSGEFYNGPSQFRGPRPKYGHSIADSDMEYNNAAPDGSYVGNGRLGRKPLNDGSYIAPRRRSPGGRDGIPMGHRNPRNGSPNRCIGNDGSEMVGMRHSEKFMRNFPEDTLDSMFTRPQPYEGMDGRFARGGRGFSSLQRRGLTRIRSKSPIRSRSRSPGPWSPPRRRSPRRRSPDGFGGPPELTHRRSSLYRVDRMRSPDRPVFPGERVVRRHGSPSFMSRPSNDMRDIDSAREHGHPRPVMSSRSPSGRILIRNRRFDVVDPRDRTDNDDDYFGGPMHSGRIMELSGEGNGEERRRFGERRGPVRTFRPPYNGNVSENFRLNAEDGPRHYNNRFCSDDSDFHERGNNMRERDFDRRIKGRPTNGPPRRTRNMDEQEENFRHGGGQVWSDDSFDDISRVKRKRF